MTSARFLEASVTYKELEYVGEMDSDLVEVEDAIEEAERFENEVLALSNCIGEYNELKSSILIEEDLLGDWREVELAFEKMTSEVEAKRLGFLLNEIDGIRKGISQGKREVEELEETLSEKFGTCPLCGGETK